MTYHELMQRPWDAETRRKVMSGEIKVKAPPPGSSMFNETEILYYELLQGTRIPVTPFEKEVARQIEEARSQGIMLDIPHDI